MATKHLELSLKTPGAAAARAHRGFSDLHELSAADVHLETIDRLFSHMDRAMCTGTAANDDERGGLAEGQRPERGRVMKFVRRAPSQRAPQRERLFRICLP